MDRLRTRRPRGVDDLVDGEIAVARRRRPDQHRLVGEIRMPCLAIRLGIDGDRMQSHLSRGADDRDRRSRRDWRSGGRRTPPGPQRRRQEGARFSRKAATPSRPSSPARTRAMVAAVSAISAAVARPAGNAVDQQLRFRLRRWSPFREQARDFRSPIHQPFCRNHLMDEAEREEPAPRRIVRR